MVEHWAINVLLCLGICTKNIWLMCYVCGCMMGGVEACMCRVVQYKLDINDYV
jgi:hypothetical protein